MKLYARINGQMTVWQTEEPDPEYARNDVLGHLAETLGGEVAMNTTILALVEGGE